MSIGVKPGVALVKEKLYCCSGGGDGVFTGTLSRGHILVEGDPEARSSTIIIMIKMINKNELL